MRILMACVSAAALAASVPALSQGQGNGNRGGNAHSDRGGGSSQADRGNRDAQRGGGNERRAERGDRADRGNAGRPDRADEQAQRGDRNTHRGERADRPADGDRRGENNRDRQAERDDRGQGNRHSESRTDRGNRGDQRAERGNREDRRADRDNGRDRDQARDLSERRERNLRVASERAERHRTLINRRDRRTDNRRDANGRDLADIDFYRERRWDGGDYRDRLGRARALQRTGWQSRFCPPGLANQNELCMPPGQYRKLYNRGARFDRRGYDLPEWYRASYRDRGLWGLFGGESNYRYANGYAYRLDPATQIVTALFPVIGGALGIGQALPTGYNVYNLPTQYRPLYRDDDFNYRYGDNAIFRVDPNNNRILGISQLLTNDFTVGRPVPSGYDAYNVPYGYRDAYSDDDQYRYRYNDGQIYQIDTGTQLVLAAINLFA